MVSTNKRNKLKCQAIPSLLNITMNTSSPKVRIDFPGELH